MKPFEEAVQEIPADKAVWYELPAQAVEMKNCRCGNGCSCNGSFGFLFSIWLTELTISAPDPIPESSHLDVIKHFRNDLSL